MHILVYSMGTKATRRTAAVHYAVGLHSLSRGNLKNLMARSSTFVCQLFYCSSKHNNNNQHYVYSAIVYCNAIVRVHSGYLNECGPALGGRQLVVEATKMTLHSELNVKPAFYVQLLQNRVYLQYGLSNGKHR